jgi:hypothetical protein
MALQYSAALRNAMLDAITTAVGASGLCRIYDGSVPANVAASIGSSTLLAELTLNSTFAAGASSGVLTLNSITSDSSANATGTATYFRLTTSGGTAVIQGTVGTSGTDLVLNTTSISSGGPVAISSWTVTASGA